MRLFIILPDRSFFSSASPVLSSFLLGTVNPTTLAVTLSPPLIVGDNPNYGLTLAITGLTATQYLVAFYGGVNMPASNLYATVFKGHSRANGTNSVMMPAPASAFPGYTLSGFFKATALDSGDVVIAFADASTNQGVTCALFSVNLNTAAILAGPTLSITTGASIESYSEISIVTIGTGSQFMVMFIDLIVNRAVVAAIGQVWTAATSPHDDCPTSHSSLIADSLALLTYRHLYTDILIISSLAVPLRARGLHWCGFRLTF
jgi:hypothetical protein